MQVLLRSHTTLLTWSPVRCWRWRNAACSSCTVPEWTLSSPRRCFQGEPVGSGAPHGSVTRLGGSHGQPVHRIISRLNYRDKQHITSSEWQTKHQTDAKKIVSASPWRTGGDHQDALVLRGWRLSSRNWNPMTSPQMKQLSWLRIVHSGDWCLCLVLHTPGCACQKKRRRNKYRVFSTIANLPQSYFNKISKSVSK